MATVTKTFVENFQTSYRSTWTVIMSQNDVTVSGSSFTLPVPTMTAKYVYAGKKNAYVSTYAYAHKGGETQWLLYGTWYRGTSPSDSTATLPTTSGTTYTLSTSGMTTPTQYTTNYFNSQNPTVRTIPISVSSATLDLYSQVNTGSTDATLNSYNGTNILWENVFNLVLDAPPTATIGTPTYSNPQYAGLGTYTVDVTTASAKYGGNINSITLTIGNQTDVKTFSSTTVTNQTFTITPAVAGTYTPTITIVDSRGQTTVKSLPQIMVGQYSNPSTVFTVIRTDASGLPDDEGAYGVASATFSYTDAVAGLLQPSVTVTDENGQSVTTTTTWYEAWTSSTGVSSVVNWTNYNPGAPVTLYGLINGSFSSSETYTVTIVANDSEGGTSTPITQTLSTGFFTIDFQAGGKEIAFGAPANDDVTNYEEGLFKCAMSFRLKDHLIWIGTRSEYDEAVDDGKMPEHSIVIITDEDADYIVEQGTSGEWTYRKWNSGIAEAWRRTSSHSYVMTNTVGGNGYASDYWTLPSGLFTSVTEAHVNRINGGNGLVSCSIYSMTTSRIDHYIWVTGATATITMELSIEVKGTWK